MLKALLRKQLLEIRNVYLVGRKGKNKAGKKVKNPKGMLVLFIVLYFVIMVSMFFMSMGIGMSLIPAGLDWLYFTIINVIAFLLGIIGSVLSTAQALFRSKDNELLLSMPIPPSKIVLVRMISVYLMSLLYECVVLVPAVIYYFIAGTPSFLSIVFCVLGILVMAFLITAFSCGAGWLVSFISSKIGNKKIVSTFVILVLIGVLYYFQFNASRFITYLVENANILASYIEGWGYPLYAPGLGMTGNAIGFLVFAAMTAVLFIAAYLAVSKSFTRIALFKAKDSHKAFHRSDIHTASVQDTLFRKEMRRFTASIAYMLNTGLGCILLLAGAVLMLIKMQDIRMFITTVGTGFARIDDLACVIVANAVCVLMGMCQISACSISMEGKYLWVYQSLPIDPYSIFMAKIKFHVTLTGIPALLLVLVSGITLQVSIPVFICLIIYDGMFLILSASYGLRADLRRPKLNWTNENQAVKSNLNVFVVMLLGIFVPAAISFLYYFAVWFISPVMYMIIWLAVFAVLAVLVFKWLAGRGRKIFAVLNA